MDLPEYVSVKEVQRVCAELGLRDWTVPGDGGVSSAEAQTILDLINTRSMPVELDEFRRRLEVELEHGLMFDDANVTNNHPVLTGMIVLAHLKESLDYYKYLEVAEIEGDLLKAAAAGNAPKLLAKYRKLVAARRELAEAESEKVDAD